MDGSITIAPSQIRKCSELINKVVLGNCLDTMARMPDGFVDLTVTSPPYDDMDEDFNPLPKRGLRQYEGYTWDFKAIARELYRVTKDGGVVVWVVGDLTIDGSESLASSLQKIYFRKVGFNIHDTMIYQKDGSPFPEQTRYAQVFEYMFIMSKGAPTVKNLLRTPTLHKPGKPTMRQKDGSLERARYKLGHPTKTLENVWRYSTGYNKSTQDHYTVKHPATFPERLASDHIVSWSNPGDLVFDCFLGSGTVAKMAILNNRSFIGSEIAPEYAPIYEKRIADALAQMSKAPRIVESGNKIYSIPPLFAE